MPETTYRVWNVRGTFIIPGTREKAHLDPIRIGHFSKAQASQDLAKILTEKFGKKLRGEHSFNPHFAIGHLQWEPFDKRKAPIPPEPSAQVEATS